MRLTKAQQICSSTPVPSLVPPRNRLTARSRLDVLVLTRDRAHQIPACRGAVGQHAITNTDSRTKRDTCPAIRTDHPHRRVCHPPAPGSALDRRPWIQHLDRKPKKVPLVACHEHQGVGDCRGRQEAVDGGQRPLGSGLHAPPAIRNRRIDVQDTPSEESRQIRLQPVTEGPPTRQIRHGLDAFAQLAQRQHAEIQGAGRSTGKPSLHLRIRPSPPQLRQYVGIDQVAHGLRLR